MMRHRQRLGKALRLVVHTSRPDRIDVAPVVLALGVDGRVPVDLAGRGEEEARIMRLGQLQETPRPFTADRQGLERAGEIRGRRRW